MRKLFLSLVVAIIAATAAYAQNTLVATLSHGDNVTMYYGTYALRDAVNAAESGDVINLSGGGFQDVEIKKALTIRGTGINAELPTSIPGTLTLNIPAADTCRFSMEGVRCNNLRLCGSFENPYFMKCWFDAVYTDSPSAIKNAMFVNCRITGYREQSFYGSTTAQFVNSYTAYIRTYGDVSLTFVNCVVLPVYGYCADRLNNCQFVNCIFYNTGYSSTNALPSTSIATNCVAINDDNKMKSLFNNSQANPNCGFASYADVFKNFTGNLTWGQTFELTDEAKTKYLGTDGTEVGMYGGVMPYTDVPSYPRITKMNVANKTTADGKLSVEIEVSAAE